MKKKQYQKPLIEKIDLKLTESILTNCKTSVAAIQATHTESPKACTASAGPAGKCSTTAGS